MVAEQQSVEKHQGTHHRGVFKCGKKFKAQIQIRCVQYYLGLFNTKEEAVKAYEKRAKLMLEDEMNNPDQVKNAHSQSLQEHLSSQKGVSKRRYQRYSGIRDTLTKIHVNDLEKIKLATSKNVISRSESKESLSSGTAATDRDDDGSSCCSSKSLLSQSSVRSFPSVQLETVTINTVAVQIEYYLGVLSYDHNDLAYHWIGTWLRSSSGKPTISDFIKSVNYFEFHSDKVPIEEVLGEAFYDEKGCLCGLIRPHNTQFRGFSTFVDAKGIIVKQAEKQFQVHVEACKNDKGIVYEYKLIGNIGTHDCLEQSPNMCGVFHCETGLLEMAKR